MKRSQPPLTSAVTIAVLLLVAAWVLYQTWLDASGTAVPPSAPPSVQAPASNGPGLPTDHAQSPPPQRPTVAPARDPYREFSSGPVLRVVDGDTLLLRNHVRVRLLGVDTPESVKPDTPVRPWGPEASVFARDLLASGVVRLEYDRERTDDYGRTLAYVWVTLPDGSQKMLNEELLRAGLARGLYRHPYSEQMKSRFRDAQREARLAKRGIWSGKTPDGSPLKWPFGPGADDPVDGEKTRTEPRREPALR